jgi:hypothetical protein
MAVGYVTFRSPYVLFSVSAVRTSSPETCFRSEVFMSVEIHNLLWVKISCSSEEDSDVLEDHASSTIVSNKDSMLPLKYTYQYTRLHGVTIQKNAYISNSCNVIVNPIGVTRLMALQNVGVAVERVASCSVVWKSWRQAILIEIVPDFPQSF